MRNSQQEQKELVRHRILNTLKDDEMQVISLTDNKHDISWEEDGNEFLFHGEMYDVVKTSLINGKTLLYCINDKKEKTLVDNYNSITKHNSADGKKGNNTVDD